MYDAAGTTCYMNDELVDGMIFAKTSRLELAFILYISTMARAPLQEAVRSTLCWSMAALPMCLMPSTGYVTPVCLNAHRL